MSIDLCISISKILQKWLDLEGKKSKTHAWTTEPEMDLYERLMAISWRRAFFWDALIMPLHSASSNTSVIIADARPLGSSSEVLLDMKAWIYKNPMISTLPYKSEIYTKTWKHAITCPRCVISKYPGCMINGSPSIWTGKGLEQCILMALPWASLLACESPTYTVNQALLLLIYHELQIFFYLFYKLAKWNKCTNTLISFAIGVLQYLK